VILWMTGGEDGGGHLVEVVGGVLDLDVQTGVGFVGYFETQLAEVIAVDVARGSGEGKGRGKACGGGFDVGCLVPGAFGELVVFRVHEVLGQARDGEEADGEETESYCACPTERMCCRR